jgi:hypothetical protein
MRKEILSVFRGTQAEIDARQSELVDVQVIVVDNAGAVVRAYVAGAAGQPIAEIPLSGSGSVIGVPANLSGTGAVALTQALHAGANWHAGSGVTSATLAGASWTTGGQLSLINHTGSDLPIVLGTGWTAGFANTRDGLAATTGTLVTLRYLEKAEIQIKSGGVVNIAVLGGSSSVIQDDWTALTRVKESEVRRSTVTIGLVKVGDLLRSTSVRITGAVLDASELANWVEISADPVTSVGGFTGAVTKTQLALENVDNTSDNNKPVSSAQLTALNLKANLASPALTGTPTAPTAATADDTSQLANTAFVQARFVTALADAAPLMSGTAAIGTSAQMAREDHVHPKQDYVKTGLDFTVATIPDRTFKSVVWCAGASATVITTANVPWVVADANAAERLAVYWLQELTTLLRGLENDTQYDQMLGAWASAASLSSQLSSGAFALTPSSATDMDLNYVTSGTQNYGAEYFELVVGANAAATELYTMGFNIALVASASYDTACLFPFRLIYQTTRDAASGTGLVSTATGAMSASAPKVTIRTGATWTTPAAAFGICAEPLTIECRR